MGNIEALTYFSSNASLKRDGCDVKEIFEIKKTKILGDIYSTTPEILLLGAGCVGKSTIYKQLRRLVMGEIIADMRTIEETRAPILTTLLYYMQWCGREHQHNPNLHNKTLTSLQYCATLDINIDDLTNSIDDTMWKHIHVIWNGPDSAFFRKLALMTPAAVHSSDLAYFFDKADRLSDPHYILTQEDILHTYVRTTGLCRSHISPHFTIVDTGGQRSERYKWRGLYSGATCVVDVVDLACYDQTIFEDSSTNGMVEQLRLWQELYYDRLVRSPWLIKCLLFNKIDLFIRKVEQCRTPITRCFSFREYSGDLYKYQPSLEYIRETFMKTLKNFPNGPVHTYVICALNDQELTSTFIEIFENVTRVAIQFNPLL